MPIEASQSRQQHSPAPPPQVEEGLTIFIASLPNHPTVNELWNVFNYYGRIKRVAVFRYAVTDRKNAYSAHITYEEPESCADALAAAGSSHLLKAPQNPTGLWARTVEASIHVGEAKSGCYHPKHPDHNAYVTLLTTWDNAHEPEPNEAVQIWHKSAAIGSGLQTQLSSAMSSPQISAMLHSPNMEPRSPTLQLPSMPSLTTSVGSLMSESTSEPSPSGMRPAFAAGHSSTSSVTSLNALHDTASTSKSAPSMQKLVEKQKSEIQRLQMNNAEYEDDIVKLSRENEQKAATIDHLTQRLSQLENDKAAVDKAFACAMTRISSLEASQQQVHALVQGQAQAQKIWSQEQKQYPIIQAFLAGHRQYVDDNRI